MRKMMWARHGAAAVALMSSVVATEAAPVTYLFSGSIDTLSEVIPGIDYGAAFSGSFTYDPSGPGLYGQFDTLNDMNATVNGLTYSSTTVPGLADTYVSSSLLLFYTYDSQSTGYYNTGPTIPTVTGSLLIPYYLSLALNSATGQITAGTLSSVLNLDSFTDPRFAFNLLNDADYSLVSASGKLDSLAMTSAVPEPATLALMLGGLASCLAVARRRGS